MKPFLVFPRRLFLLFPSEIQDVPISQALARFSCNWLLVSLAPRAHSTNSSLRTGHVSFLPGYRPPFTGTLVLSWSSPHSKCMFSLSLFSFFFFFFFFLGLQPWHMEVPSKGSNCRCCCWPTPQPQQCQIQAVSVTYAAAL